MENRMIKAGEFKTHCLKLMDQVKKTHRKIIITKRNAPVAQLVPCEEGDFSVFGKLKGSVIYHSNIIDPIDEVWDASY